MKALKLSLLFIPDSLMMTDELWYLLAFLNNSHPSMNDLFGRVGWNFLIVGASGKNSFT